MERRNEKEFVFFGSEKSRLDYIHSKLIHSKLDFSILGNLALELITTKKRFEEALKEEKNEERKKEIKQILEYINKIENNIIKAYLRLKLHRIEKREIYDRFFDYITAR